MKPLLAFATTLLALVFLPACGDKSANTASTNQTAQPKSKSQLTPDEKAAFNHGVVIAKSYVPGASLNREETALLSKIREQEAARNPIPKASPAEEAVTLKLISNQPLTAAESEISFEMEKNARKRQSANNSERKAFQRIVLGYTHHLDSIDNVIRWLNEGDAESAKQYLIYKDQFNDDYRVQNIVNDYVIYVNQRTHGQIALVKRPGGTYIEKSPLANSCFAFLGVEEFSKTFGGQSQLPVFIDKSEDIKNLKLIE